MSAGQGIVEPPGGDEGDLQAAEYVLGTLPAEERNAYARRLAADAGAQAAVRAWEARLSPLALAIPEENPPAGIWEAIVRALPGSPEAANDNAITALRRALRRWRLAAGAGLVAAGLALSIALGWKPGGEPGALYVAVVTSAGEVPALIVSVDTGAGTARVRPLKAGAPSGRSLELWYVGADKTPKTLGLIGTDANRIALPPAAKSGEGVFAVSVEPPGGSPTGQPTGQVIYTGTLVRD